MATRDEMEWLEIVDERPRPKFMHGCFLCDDAIPLNPSFYASLRVSSHPIHVKRINDMLEHVKINYYPVPGGPPEIVYVDFFACEEHEDDLHRFEVMIADEPNVLTPQILAQLIGGETVRVCDCNEGCGRTVKLSRQDALDYHKQEYIVVVKGCTTEVPRNEVLVEDKGTHILYRARDS